MIARKTQITEARCDACGKDLMRDIGDGHKSANYAEVVPSFGYGSPLDPMGATINPRYHLCEECFAKAMNAVLLPVHDLDPVVCPVCRKPRQGENDHPACMKTWYPHPDSDPARELAEDFNAHQKQYDAMNRLNVWNQYQRLKAGLPLSRGSKADSIEAMAKHYEIDVKPPSDEQLAAWRKDAEGLPEREQA